jgi:hypothetical protein
MPRGEIRLTGSLKQTEALKWYLQKFYPEYTNPQEFFKKEFENVTGIKWNQLQDLHEKSTKVKK